MKAEDARELYYSSILNGALENFYEVIRATAPFSLSGNFYETAVIYDYTILRRVKEELEKQGYRVAYSDGKIRSTGIFSISWD